MIPPPGPGPGPSPSQNPRFGSSGFSTFQPPPPDPFSSRGRYDPPPTNDFGNFNFGAQPSSFNRSSTTKNQSSSNLFGLQTVTLTRQKQNIVAPQDDISLQIDDTIYELPEQPDLELANGLIEPMGVEANDLVDTNIITKEEENDSILEQIKQDYNFDEIKDALDEGTVHESVEFFYGGENENFVRNIEFLNPRSDNREFFAFLLSDLGRNVMTSNRLSIQISSGDIYYKNHNTGKSIYTFLVDQQNEDKAFIPKQFTYKNSFEKYISNFLPSFSIDDVEKYDLYAKKNLKYMFYRFNEYIKAYGGKRREIKHTQKLKDSIGLKKIEERNEQFLVEKIIHSIEFQNPYTNSVEQKPEIIDTVETNYKIARRVYQDLYLDIADLFQKLIRSFPPQDIQDMDDDIKSNEWGARNILDIEHSLELLNIFQTFYHTTGRLPLSNGLLIVPDGDAPAGENKVNMKSLFDMSRHTYSRGLVSLPFLGVIHYYFDATDQQLIENALTELYGNLSYITLSGARDFEFDNISNLTARIIF